MHLFARNEEEGITSAQEAQGQRDYFCLECNSSVRVRGGLHRRKHFYHTTQERSCSLSGKGMIHLQIQCAIKDKLPEGEVLLERRFNEIDRIADVCWEPHKLIFEVQCSPISAEEIRERNADYHSVGYQVVWILHDKRYNRMRVSSAEKYLAGHPHYFTNIDRDGEGVIYDQLSMINRGIRKTAKGKLPIKLASVFYSDSKKRPFFPSIATRLKAWRIYFEGDLIDLVTCDALSDEQRLFLENEALDFVYMGRFKYFLSFFSLFIEKGRGIYSQFLRIILENACK